MAKPLHSAAMLASVQEKLGYQFTDSALLSAALTHPSINHEDGANYERLEFLGDAVIDVAVSEMLYNRFPEEPEGALAKRRAALVCRASLADISERLGLREPLADALKYETRGVLAALENTLEAVFGAIYLDGGLLPAITLATRLFGETLQQMAQPPRDAKTRLQEWAQGNGLPIPHYSITRKDGPSHEPHFTVQVSVQGFAEAFATGTSKKAAEQEAAAKFLQQLDTVVG